MAILLLTSNGTSICHVCIKKYGLPTSDDSQCSWKTQRVLVQ